MKIVDYYVADGFSKNGSCKQSQVITTYDRLHNLFGEPTYTDADPYAKVSCEWVLRVKVKDTGDGYEDTWYEEVSIYAWKYGRIPTEETQWNIGGYNWESQELVESIIDRGLEPEYSEVA